MPEPIRVPLAEVHVCTPAEQRALAARRTHHDDPVKIATQAALRNIARRIQADARRGWRA